MAGIVKLATFTDASGTSSGHLIFTAASSYIASIVVSNTNESDGANGGDGIASVYTTATNGTEAVSVIHKLPIPVYNSYETFKFPLNSGDKLYVYGSAGLTYFLMGINQS